MGCERVRETSVLTLEVELLANLGEVNVDNVAKCLLRVLGDAHGRNLARDINPLVGLGVALLWGAGSE